MVMCFRRGWEILNLKLPKLKNTEETMPTEYLKVKNNFQYPSKYFLGDFMFFVIKALIRNQIWQFSNLISDFGKQKIPLDCMRFYCCHSCLWAPDLGLGSSATTAPFPCSLNAGVFNKLNSLRRAASNHSPTLNKQNWVWVLGSSW